MNLPADNTIPPFAAQFIELLLCDDATGCSCAGRQKGLPEGCLLGPVSD